MLPHLIILDRVLSSAGPVMIPFLDSAKLIGPAHSPTKPGPSQGITDMRSISS